MVRAGWVREVTRVRTMRLNFGIVRTEDNLLMSLGPHEISLVLALCGDESPVSVYAMGQYTVSPGVQDHFEFYLRFGNGVQAYISVSWMHFESTAISLYMGRKGVCPEGDKPNIEGYKWSAERLADRSAVEMEGF